MRYSIRPNIIYKVLKSDIPIDELIVFIENMYKFSKEKGFKSYDAAEQIKGELGMSKKKLFKNEIVTNFIKENAEILKKIKETDLFYTIVFDYNILNQFEDYKVFLTYISEKVKENKDNIIEIFKTIVHYNTFELIYTDEEINNRYYITISKNYFDNNKYNISGVLTDGETIFLNSYYKGTYPMIVHNANFIVTYDISGLHESITYVIIRNLDFDAKKLLDKQVLLDNTKPPYIDLKDIEQKSETINNLYYLEELIAKIENNIKMIKNNEVSEIKDKLLPLYEKQLEELNEEKNDFIKFLNEEKNYTEEIIEQGLNYLKDVYFNMSIDID